MVKFKAEPDEDSVKHYIKSSKYPKKRIIATIYSNARNFSQYWIAQRKKNCEFLIGILFYDFATPELI